jgi:hypothetical protein
LSISRPSEGLNQSPLHGLLKFSFSARILAGFGNASEPKTYW